MASYQSYCLKPDYFTGVSGWANSSTNDQWLIKNRGQEVSYLNTLDGSALVLFISTLHYNRDEPHGAFMTFIPKGIELSIVNNRGYSTYFQCKGV